MVRVWDAYGNYGIRLSSGVVMAVNLKVVSLFIMFLVVAGFLVSPVKADAEADFESLFFGAGAWLGLLLFMIVSVALVAISKYTAVFVVVITVMFEVEYYNRLDIYGNHVWKMVILLFFALFVCITALLDKRR